MRKHFIDNLRWCTVLLVLVYHVFYNFNAVGVLGGVGPFSEIQYQDGILYLVYPWFMVLLFIVSGMSSRYALEKCEAKEFLKNRTRKLLVPATIGLLVYQWMLGYFNIRIGGGWDTIPTPIRYPVMAISGTGPLWFIQDLWIYSLLLIVIRKFFSGHKLSDMIQRLVNKNVVLFFCSFSLIGFLILWGASQSQIDDASMILAIINQYRPIFYFVPFLMGYYIFSSDAILNMIQEYLWILLTLSVIGAITYVALYFGEDYTSSDCLQSLLTNMYAWIVILTLFAGFRTWADHENRFSSYMTLSSFGLYIVHMLICTATCFYLKNTSLPIWTIYTISIISTIGLSLLVYEVIKRLPCIRWCILGYSKK